MFNERFQDIYFQKNAIQESQYVFIEGNQLQERFRVCKNFSICELGFGTGLNFLLTAKLFLETNTKGMLYYFSIEKYPLSIYEMKQALSKFSEIKLDLEYLLELFKWMYYPTIGFLTFYYRDRVRVTLLLGDVLEMLKEIHHTFFDCWYLDGFSPSKNPEMWRKEIYFEMARLSKPNATFATFSCAKIVKEGLQEANFYIEKRKGFEKKREMLVGYYLGSKSFPPNSYKKIGIIGGGISGIATALSLLKRGYEVHLFEKHSSMMTETSSVPAALVMPYFGSVKNLITDLTLMSFNFLASLLYHVKYFKRTSLPKWILIQNIRNKEKLKEIENLYKISKQSIREYKGIYFLKAYVIDQKELFSLLENILFSYKKFYYYPNTEIVEFLEDQDFIYIMDKKSKIYPLDVVVFCNSHNVKYFFNYLDLQKVRGQLIEINHKYIQPLKRNVISEISVLKIKDKILIGSSYENYKHHLQRDPQSDEYILKKLKNHCIFIFDQIAKCTKESFEFVVPTSAFVGFRSQSKDYMPNIGNAVDVEKYLAFLTTYFYNKKCRYLDIPLLNRERIFLNTSHGSRGFTTSFFGGELIASLIAQNPIPIGKQLFLNLHPHRFLFRNWRSFQRKEYSL